MSGPWIQLRSGAVYEYGSETCEGLNFRLDIVKPLSRIARFLGHTQIPWSVAAHAVCCARFAAVKNWPLELQWLCLHHDDAEALVGDIPAPMKRWLEQGRSGMDIANIEFAASLALRNSLNDYRMPDVKQRHAIKVADLAILMGEAHELMLPPPKQWGVPVDDGDRVLAMAIVNRYLSLGDGWGVDAENEYLIADADLREELGWGAP